MQFVVAMALDQTLGMLLPLGHGSETGSHYGQGWLQTHRNALVSASRVLVFRRSNSYSMLLPRDLHGEEALDRKSVV